MAISKPTVLITGCSSGIGKALAWVMHERGWRVLATARSYDKIEDLTVSGMIALELDVDSPESIAALKKEVQHITQGKLDMLINNAGRNLTVPALDLDMNEVEACFKTNLFGVMRMCQTFAPFLIEAQGTIVQIGSVAGIMPYVFGSAYNSTKAALHQYSNTLRVELAPFGVRVRTVVTGGVKSNIARNSRKLPADSIYLPIKEEYERRVTHSQEVGIPTEQYAKSVINQLLGSNKKFIWEGFGSTLVWFASIFLPIWVMDYYFTREFNLARLGGGFSWARIAQAQQSAKKMV